MKRWKAGGFVRQATKSKAIIGCQLWLSSLASQQGQAVGQIGTRDGLTLAGPGLAFES
jgi:hypothetical protein